MLFERKFHDENVEVVTLKMLLGDGKAGGDHRKPVISDVEKIYVRLIGY
ncbi:hypothetical protein GCM10007086_01370 [Photobacterium aphoticum]|nr:hypothetical protein GCM10007086_01370 [Photobacterium aphoticum]